MASQILKEFIINSTKRQAGAPCPTSDYDLRYDPDNGNVDVVRRVGINIFNQPDLNDPCEYIFRNGSFTQNAIATFGQTNIDSLYQEIKDEVKKKRAVLGGTAGGAIKPSFLDVARAPVVGQPSNLPQPVQTNTGGLAGANGGGLGLGQPLLFPSVNEDELFGKSAKGLLIYPFDLLETRQDILQINQYRYKSPSGEAFLNGDVKDILLNGLQRNSAILQGEDKIVILPMPNDVKDNNSVSWGPDSMNNLTSALIADISKDPAKTIAQIGLGKAAGAATGFDATGLIKYLDLAMQAGGTNALQNQAVATQLKSVLTSYAAKQFGFEVPPETILARGLGIVPNSNLELLFNSPTLRDFNFGYKLTPRSQEEAKNVRRIIRFFKQGMAVRKLNASSGAGAGSLFLGTPNIFKLTYKSNGGAIKGVNRIKICALTGFSVNYTPESQWASYVDETAPGQPISLTMGMSFTELEPIFESDYQQTIFKSDKTDLSLDLDPIGPDDIGY
jgi:hypothetical protein